MCGRSGVSEQARVQMSLSEPRDSGHLAKFALGIKRTKGCSLTWVA